MLFYLRIIFKVVVIGYIVYIEGYDVDIGHYPNKPTVSGTSETHMVTDYARYNKYNLLLTLGTHTFMESGTHRYRY